MVAELRSDRRDVDGAATKAQKIKGIEDSIELFTSDTLKGGDKRPEVVKVVCGNSGADVDWLVDKFDLDLSLVARLGGHSAPRTHRGKERFPGMTITYALIQMLEKVAEKTDRARIITKARAHKMLTNPSSGACVGLIYEKGGKDEKEYGPVILASGGFGADFTQNSLLAQYRPDLMHLPTTLGEHCTGEASGKTGSGTKFYHNIIPGSAVKTEPFYVAIITPVIHYCMGGLEIDCDSAVLGSSGKAIPGLYAAGEVAGGVHGNNRLGGNSLLDCVVFGRVAAKAACKWMFGAQDEFRLCPIPKELKELTK